MTVQVTLGPRVHYTTGSSANVVAPGTTFSSNDMWYSSPYEGYVLIFQADGNLVLYEVVGTPPPLRQGATFTGQPIWSSSTSKNEKDSFEVQSGGNLVIYNSGRNPIWASNTDKTVPVGLNLQDDGNLVLYKSVPSWASNTARIPVDRDTKITNLYPVSGWDKIFWRVFQPYDDTHIFGAGEGLLSTGQSVTYSGPPEFFQLEFKKLSVIGPIIVQAIPIFSTKSMDFELLPDGSLNVIFPDWDLNRGKYTNWMDNDKIQNKTLLEVTLPLTHDSGAYRLSSRFVEDSKAGIDVADFLNSAFMVVGTVLKPIVDEVAALFRGLSQAQSMSIDRQLNEGIRIFDLRVVTVRDNFNTSHALVGESIPLIFHKIRQFLEKTKRELVIVNLGTGSSTSDAGKARLKALIEEKFNGYIVPLSVDLKKTKIKDMTQGKSKVIVLGEGFHNADALGFTMDAGWVNTDDFNDLKRGVQKRVIENQRKDVMVVVPWTMTTQTPSIDDLVKALGSGDIDKVGEALRTIIRRLLNIRPIRVMAEEVNSELKPFVEGQLKGLRINAIQVDFFEGSAAVEMAVAISSQ